MMKELQPVNQNVLIEMEKKEEKKTASGIIIPDTASESQNIGKVAAMSKIENPEIVVGDMVMFKENAGEETEFEDKRYVLVQYADILSKVVETESI